MLYFLRSAIVRMILIDDFFATGEKVSLKSKPCYCENPFATYLVLYFDIILSACFFNLFVHLHPIKFFCLGKGTSSHVLFFIRALHSLFIAAINFSL